MLMEVSPRHTGVMATVIAPGGDVDIAAVAALFADRTRARKEKNWPRADEIRAELDRLDVQVTDTPAGPTWHLR